MKALALVLTIFSCLVLGTHFLRAGLVAVTGLCVALPPLLVVRRRWAARLLLPPRPEAARTRDAA